MRRNKKVQPTKTTKKAEKSPSAKDLSSKSKPLLQTKIPSQNYSRHNSPHPVFSIKSISKPSCKRPSFKISSHLKTKDLFCQNPEIQVRKSTPCIRRDSSSIQNQYHRQISHNNKTKDKISKEGKLPKDKEETSLKKNKLSLKSFQNSNLLKLNTSGHQNDKTNKVQNQKDKICTKNRKIQRFQRKSAQTCIERSKTCSKSKHSKQNQQTRINQLQSKNLLYEMNYQSKSSCITRNISNKNSKEKDQGGKNKQLQKKFKKKQDKEKKLRKQPINASMKISQRNSFRFVEKSSNQFILVQRVAQQHTSQISFIQKLESQALPLDFPKIKSYRCLDFLIDNETDTNKKKCSESKHKELKLREFSFQKNGEMNEGNDKKVHQISIDYFLESEQMSFLLQSEESLKQRLTRIQLSLEQLKEQEFPNMDQIHSLNEFLNKLENQKELSEIYEIDTLQCRKLQKIKFPQDRSTLLKRIEIIDWISILSSTMLLKTQTFQLAVAYFDIFNFGQPSQESYLIDITQKDQHLRLVSLACLSLAIKMDERELQHDIFNAFTILNVGFRHSQILQTQKIILNKLKIKLKIQTLSFWLDFLSSKWDHFVQNSPFQEKKYLSFKFIDGKSYENYQKAVQIMNSIILEGGIFKFQLSQIVFAIILIVCEENIENLHRQRVFEQINNFRANCQKRAEDEKQNLPFFATQQTLDELVISGSKQSFSYDEKIQNNESRFLERTNYKQGRKSATKPQDLIDLKTKFIDNYKDFVKKNGNKEIEKMRGVIKYIQCFSKMKFVLEVEPRVYEEAQTYEEFIRYHSYSPHIKMFALRRIQDTFPKQMKNHISCNQSSSNQHQAANKISYRSELSQQLPQIVTDNLIACPLKTQLP